VRNLLVNLQNVSILQNKNLILDSIDLEIFEGEFVFLIGKTGSGKSSLLKTIYADLPMKSGKGDVCGQDLSEITLKKTALLRRKLGIVFQNFELLTDRSVSDNLEFVLRATGWNKPSAIKSRIDDVLEAVGLSHKLNKLPFELSGGEQQRVAIARALLNSPHLIIADEPTGNLDPSTAKEILDLLQTISKGGTTILMASHDYDAMKKYSTRILLCQDKKIIEAPNTNDILKVIQQS
jgi:cell division transport system ATP-binding protein